VCCISRDFSLSLCAFAGKINNPAKAQSLTQSIFEIVCITLWALGSLVVGNFQAANGFDIKFVNGLASLFLIALAVY
jgi:hypothetical protein